MLSIWLPCNKDLRNQGLTYSLPTGNYEIVNDGPYGKCVHTTSAGCIDTLVKSADGWNVPDGCGFGAWLKFNITEMRFASAYSYTSTYNVIHSNVLGFNSYGGFSLDLTSNNIYSDGAFNTITLQPHIRYNASNAPAGKSVTFNEWHHYYTQYDNVRKVVEFYYDGALFSSGSASNVPVSALQQTFRVNHAAVWGGNAPGKYLPYYVADVRVNQGLLKPEEVKEVYKCKVFDLDTNAYIKGDITNYLAHANTEKTLGWSSYGFGGKGVISKAPDTIIPPCYGNVIKVAASAVSGTFNAEAARSFAVKQLKTGEKVTFSYYAKGEGSSIGKNATAHIYNSSGSTTISTGTDSKLTSDWKRISHTFTWTGTNVSNTSFNVYVVGRSFVSGNYFYATNFQFELGNTAHEYQFSRGVEEKPVDMGGFVTNMTPTNVVKSGSTLYFGGSAGIDMDGLRISGGTLSMWINTDRKSTQFMMADSVSHMGLTVYSSTTTSSGIIPWIGSGSKKRFYSTLISWGQWNNVTTVFNELCEPTACYINGQAAEQYGTDYWSGTNENASIGKRPNNSLYYKGYIGGIKVFRKQFTAEEALALYNKERVNYQ